MTLHESTQRRRILVVWIATVVVCATAVAASLLAQPLHGRFLGISVAFALTATAYLAGAAASAAAWRWFRAAPKRTDTITVRELRRRAGYGD